MTCKGKKLHLVQTFLEILQSLISFIHIERGVVGADSRRFKGFWKSFNLTIKTKAS
jgi:hypothetical protein